jgi:hypothetical protein
MEVVQVVAMVVVVEVEPVKLVLPEDQISEVRAVMA